MMLLRAAGIVFAALLLCAGEARAGDAIRGRAVFETQAKGNCAACHARGIAGEMAGDLGPSLAGVGARVPMDELRQRVADARVFNPETIMPPYRATAGLARVAPEYAGNPVLSAAEVEDVAAYLATLR